MSESRTRPSRRSASTTGATPTCAALIRSSALLSEQVGHVKTSEGGSTIVEQGAAPAISDRAATAHPARPELIVNHERMSSHIPETTFPPAISRTPTPANASPAIAESARVAAVAAARSRRAAQTICP